MFSLGQQNRANAAFIFHPNPSWERHGSHSKAQVLSATRLGMSFALYLCNIIQFSAGGFPVNRTAIWGIKKQHQKTKSISFLCNLQSQKSLQKKKKKASQKVKQQPVVLLKFKNTSFFSLQAFYPAKALSAPPIGVLRAEDK